MTCDVFVPLTLLQSRKSQTEITVPGPGSEEVQHAIPPPPPSQPSTSSPATEEGRKWRRLQKLADGAEKMQPTATGGRGHCRLACPTRLISATSSPPPVYAKPFAEASCIRRCIVSKLFSPRILMRSRSAVPYSKHRARISAAGRNRNSKDQGRERKAAR